MKLTAKQLHCLRQIAKRPQGTFDIARDAPLHGFKRVRCQYEWADAPFRELRSMGLIEKTGRKVKADRAEHRITDKGAAVLVRNGEEMI